ncbi:hypothetical protein BT63DRAFT_420770 [Microthyrium microscopicum]|uniref:Secreted protein n=1 Tax=Microthyrium microscopicum TaxID=703497 RepID=A0A6A6UTW5_9PEZI|nr:hypothetical protein BT63DRAFT_420770 [Microthyrium microscopicum]
MIRFQLLRLASKVVHLFRLFLGFLDSSGCASYYNASINCGPGLHHSSSWEILSQTSDVQPQTPIVNGDRHLQWLLIHHTVAVDTDFPDFLFISIRRPSTCLPLHPCSFLRA